MYLFNYSYGSVDGQQDARDMNNLISQCLSVEDYFSTRPWLENQIFTLCDDLNSYALHEHSHDDL